MSTDNEYFIKGSHKDHNIITYDKGHAPVQKMTTTNITACVAKGFGTGVGGFSNCATILYSMAAIFNKPNQQEEHDELLTRIKLLREIVGQEIDRIKGADKPFLPASWKKYEEILPTDSQEEKEAKYRHNSLVISKKPYFFRYLYPELNKRYKQFEASYNQVSRDMFGIKFKKLLKKEDKTPEEINLIRKYQKYSPLITSHCNMNILCKAIEDVDFDIKYAKNSSARSLLPTFEKTYAASFNEERLNFVKKLYQRYNARKQIKQITTLVDSFSPSSNTDDFLEIRHTMFDVFIGELQEELAKNNMSGSELLFYVSRLAPTYSSFNYGFVWDILEDQIVSLIPQGHTLAPIRATADTPNAHEYLSEYYRLIDVSSIDNLTLEALLNSLFEFPEDVLSLEEIHAIREEQEKESYDGITLLASHSKEEETHNGN